MTVGIQTYADGNTPGSARYGRTGEAIVGLAGGKYYELASRGLLFCAADQGVGVAIQTAIGTTGNITLYNPSNSGKRLELLVVTLSYFSGTFPAGSFYHGANPLATLTAPSGGTTLVSYPTSVGLLAAPAAVGVVQTGATVVAGRVLFPFGSAEPILATTASNPFIFLEDLDGAITLEPGGTYQLLSVMGGAGTSPKASFGLLWAEIPLSQNSP